MLFEPKNGKWLEKRYFPKILIKPDIYSWSHYGLEDFRMDELDIVSEPLIS